mgnify:CR=1 FL=1
MRERKQNAMREAELDRLLECGLTDLPPGDVLEDVTPWKRAMNRVLLGMALTGITLNVLCLNYLLPAVGMALLLLGFRALRRENRWFGVCWGITVVRTAYGYGLLVLDTTILRGAFYASPAAVVLAAADLALLLAECFCLRGGLRAVQEKAGLPPHVGGAAALMVWYGILGILAVIGYSGLLLGVAVIVMYVLTLRSLWKLSKELDEAGYGVRPAPVRVSDRAVAGALAAVLALGCACGYLLGGRYPMEWAPVDAGEHSGVEESKARLLALGVPDYVLNDLTAEDLAACDGAILVVVDVDDYPVNSGRRVSHSYWIGGERHTNIHTVYDVKELRITGVGVELPGERWMLIQHFLWTTPPGFCGTESIQLWPAYRAGMEGWRSGGALTGRVLYDEGGQTYAAPYCFLGEQTFAYDIARYLKEELESLGLEEITLDENGYLFATLPANTDKPLPVIGFIAHMDTSPDMSGKNVSPRIVQNYDGKDIVLCAEENVVLSPAQFPELLDHQGEDLIVIFLQPHIQPLKECALP